MYFLDYFQEILVIKNIFDNQAGNHFQLFAIAIITAAVFTAAK